ncbi:MAG: serine protease, partial [Sphingobacteriales bacterium]
VNTDEHVFLKLMPLFFEKSGAYVPATFTRQYQQNGSDYEKWATYAFHSISAGKEGLDKIAASANPIDSLTIIADPAWQLYDAVTTLRKEKISTQLTQYYDRMNVLNRLYMNAQMQLDKEKTFYPDANFSLRLTYGKIKGIDPDGDAGYSFQTTLDEVMAKDNPAVEEFRVPEKLKELYAKKDFGRWAVNGTVPVAFIAANHTSGGNSGSPVLNAKGQLIGTNFDRIWEGTMSDLYFDPNLCRNISLDVRYTLFVVEKVGGAGWLLKELNIVQK